MVALAFGSKQSLIQSDAYTTLEFADGYHQARQSATRWADFSDEEKQQRLTSASDWIDRLAPDGYIGQPENPQQTRAFPRFLPHDTLATTPFAVIQACCELALLDDVSGTLPNASKLKSVAGVYVKDGDCGADDKTLAMSLQSVLLMLEPFKRKARQIRLERG